MNTAIYFGISAAAGLIGWLTIFATIIWPRGRRPQTPGSPMAASSSAVPRKASRGHRTGL
jgi:hypothetical protein